MSFAKIYGGEDDQILVMMCSGKTGPEVRIFFEPPGAGISHFCLEFRDWDACEKAFDKTDEPRCRKIIAGIIRDMGLPQSETAHE